MKPPFKLLLAALFAFSFGSLTATILSGRDEGTALYGASIVFAVLNGIGMCLCLGASLKSQEQSE